MNHNSQYYSGETIHRYLSNQMDPPEKAEFEYKLSHDSFLQEALEGYRLTGASPCDVSVIDDMLPTKSKLFRKLTGIALAAAAVFAAIVLLSYLLNLNTNSLIKSKQLIAHRGDVNHRLIEITPDTIGTIVNRETLFIAEFRKKPEPRFIAESIAPLYADIRIHIDNSNYERNSLEYYRYSSNQPYTYIAGFKVVDYRFARRNNRRNNEIPTNRVLTGNEEYLYKPLNEQIAYVDFLEESLLMMQQKNYYDAIEAFDEILDQYPDDANAMFYKSICMYQVNQNRQALEGFAAVAQMRVNTFYEDARWYSSIILKEEKQYAAAEKALNEIVRDNGYYGVQARRELDELYKMFQNE